jgi:hypothetical protein
MTLRIHYSKKGEDIRKTTWKDYYNIYDYGTVLSK